MAKNFTLSSEISTCGEKESLTIAVLGSSGVGKSTLVCRLLKHWNELSKQKWSKSKKKEDTFNVVGSDLNVHLVNTSHGKTMKGLLLPNCDVFVIVYSIVDCHSFKSACMARDHILGSAKRDVPIIFVANKTDIAGSVEVMIRCSRNSKVTVRMNHSHLETSAETDSSTLDVFNEILKKSLFCGSVCEKTTESGKGRKIDISKIKSVATDKKLSKSKKWNWFRKCMCAI